jgi:hypothetical protein
MCHEPGYAYPPFELSYNWQAEFRSKQLWSHEALDGYKYMMWYDSDAMATAVWQQDPIATMARHDLAILFERLLNHLDGGPLLHQKIQEGFGRDICGIRVFNGTLLTESCHQNKGQFLKVHGFFYVVDLEFFRSPPVLNFLTNIFIGDAKFARRWDDQLAVVIPPAMLAANQSWQMYDHNVKLHVLHNWRIDGRVPPPGRPEQGYLGFWRNKANFPPEARKQCDRYVRGNG